MYQAISIESSISPARNVECKSSSLHRYGLSNESGRFIKSMSARCRPEHMFKKKKARCCTKTMLVICRVETLIEKKNQSVRRR